VEQQVDTGHTYICIDLKTFYASVECAARGLDPFTTNLVVADPTRTEKTICLAITPAMKALGIRNRCRVFEIPKGIDYIMAPPRMRLYMEVSADIYSIYLRYIAPEDIYVYSIDECFIDVTPYLGLYGLDAVGLSKKLMAAVFEEKHICATAGIGPNLFLAKVALDIMAKHAPDGIGILDEASFKEKIWTHRPITDIWNVGPGIAARLEKYGVRDLLGVCWLDPELLYREFGVNAEYLIDHAHGVEPCTIAQIKAYVPQGSSLQQGQVLKCAYEYEQAHTVMREMVDMLVLDLVDKHLVAGGIALSVGYDAKDAGDKLAPATPGFQGEHGRAYWKSIPRTGASRKLPGYTSSSKKLVAAFEELWAECVCPDLKVRRLSVAAENLLGEEFATVDLFTDLQAEGKERDLQRAVLAVKSRFGKNSLLTGTNFREGATGRERNELVGGHRG
jgi:DNA polymerase V